MAEGLRYNAGKLRLELIPPEIKIALASVLGKGAEKYEDRNWEKGLDWMATKACLERHLMKWEMGEELDEETGLPHLWHMLCNAAFLVTMADRGIGDDTRPLERPTHGHGLTTPFIIMDEWPPEPGEYVNYEASDE